MELFLVIFSIWFLGVGVPFLYLVYEEPVKLFSKIMNLEMSIMRHLILLKKYSDPNEVDEIESRLLELFDIYSRYKFPSYVSLDYLFPGGKKTQKKLSPNELETSNKLFPYFTNYQYILSYKDGCITMTELIRRLT